MTDIDNVLCPLCDKLLAGEIVWINPIKMDAAISADQAIGLSPAIGNADSGGGFAPYHLACAAKQWPELDL